jgi:uncharacterized protein YutD
MISIQGRTFELEEDSKKAWIADVFRERYSAVLDRYDYIVGDWGYNQLRLKGFFHDHHTQATADNTFRTLQDYLVEYCSIGCPYFILKRVVTGAMGDEEAQGGSPFEETMASHPYVWRDASMMRRGHGRDHFLNSRSSRKEDNTAGDATEPHITSLSSMPLVPPLPETETPSVIESTATKKPMPKRMPTRVDWDEEDFDDEYEEMFERKPKRGMKTIKNPYGSKNRDSRKY